MRGSTLSLNRLRLSSLGEHEFVKKKTETQWRVTFPLDAKRYHSHETLAAARAESLPSESRKLVQRLVANLCKLPAIKVRVGHHC